jgi:hypothetical protein
MDDKDLFESMISCCADDVFVSRLQRLGLSNIVEDRFMGLRFVVWRLSSLLLLSNPWWLLLYKTLHSLSSIMASSLVLCASFNFSEVIRRLIHYFPETWFSWLKYYEISILCCFWCCGSCLLLEKESVYECESR